MISQIGVLRTLSFITKACFVIFSLLLVVALLSAHQRKQKYNVVLISVDTIEYEALIKQKNKLDEIFLNESINFENVYTQIPFTYPSFVGLFTGLTPLHTRITSNSDTLISGNTITLPKILKKNGYNITAYISNRFINRSLLGGPGLANVDRYDAYGKWKTHKTDYDEFIDKSITKLNSKPKEPYFIWIHLMDTHYPYFGYTNSKCTKENCNYLNEQSMNKFVTESQPYFGCNNENTDISIRSRVIDSQYKLYNEDITMAISKINKVINALKKSDSLKKTIVVVYGDHGEGFDHNFYFHHGGVLYNSSVKIPLILYHPDIPARTISQLVSNIDILPTLLDMLKIPYDTEQFDGKSFNNLLQTPSILAQFMLSPNKYAFFYNINLTKFGVTDGTNKYIYSQENSCLFNKQKEELYNLKDDSREKNNLINTKLDITRSLRQVLMKHLGRYNLPLHDLETTAEKNDSEGKLENLKSFGY